jgi:hypothetical protein
MEKLVSAAVLWIPLQALLSCGFRFKPRRRLMTIFFVVLGSAGFWTDHDAQRVWLAKPRRKPCDQIIDLAA